MPSAIHDIPVKTIDGGDASLADHDGKVLLVVNVASKCGLTPQYEGLEALYGKYRDQGFEVLGFPANDFGAQEPGTEAEIKDFCSSQYDVSFPLFSKIAVTGDDTHPLYRAMIDAQPEADGGEAMRERLVDYGMTPNAKPGVLWNFEKFLIGRDGAVVARFTPDTAPDSPTLVAAIERELVPSE